MGCSAMGFPKLQELYLSHLFQLWRLQLARGTMKSLVNVAIGTCPLLESLPEEIEGMRALKRLTLQTELIGPRSSMSPLSKSFHAVNEVTVW